MTAYYNEFDPYAAQWLRNLIAAGHIATGDVDERSILDVRSDDLKGYTQCHFFAGIGGWSLAARLAGWPDERPLWTGSCPCQPFSVAGKQQGTSDERHLWPTFFALIGANRPAVVMGEQVAAAVGKDWLDGVHTDLESIGYACGATVVPACAVDAPHRRDRLWFVADRYQPSESEGRQQRSGQLGRAGSDTTDSDIPTSDTNNSRSQGYRQLKRIDDETGRQEPDGYRPENSFWDGTEWRIADGKARRVKSGLRLLAHGVPARVGRLRAYGNAIVPQVAAEIIGAYIDARHIQLIDQSELFS
jgi:DNA (cytosine-5)-methyltransferase 1